jgi:hypothetical protein
MIHFDILVSRRRDCFNGFQNMLYIGGSVGLIKIIAAGLIPIRHGPWQDDETAVASCHGFGSMLIWLDQR